MFIKLTSRFNQDTYYVNPETIFSMLAVDGVTEILQVLAPNAGCIKVLETPEEILALIAEIRRLRGGGHRKCPCGGLGGIKKMHGKYWAECNNCECSTDTLDTPEEAWAAWDGVA